MKVCFSQNSAELSGYVVLEQTIHTADSLAPAFNYGDESGRSPNITWWLTGQPGAGKTTMANALAERLRVERQPVCVLDGDEIVKVYRQILVLAPKHATKTSGA